MLKRTMLVDGYRAKPKPQADGERGLQANSTSPSRPPAPSELPRNNQSAVKPPKAG